MATVLVRDELGASIQTVWDLIEDFGDLSAWAPNATVTEVKGTGVGAVRRVQLDEPGAMVFRERCEAHDPEAHSFSYAVVESPIPFKNYVSVVKLSDLGPGRCGIEWSSRFEPDGAPEEVLISGVEDTYAAFIASIKQTLSES
jgi:mxaD protein